MMIAEILGIIAIGAALVLVAMVVYVNLLLGLARFSAGIVKFVSSMFIYLASCLIFVAPLFFLIDAARFALQESMWAFGYVIPGYAAILAPGFYYLSKGKIRELQKAGYFLPRH